MYTQKDLNRIETLAVKVNAIQLAHRMADSIKNGEKAWQRAAAALSLGYHRIAGVFIDKAKVLGIDVSARLEIPIRLLGSELSVDNQHKSNARTNRGGDPILPCGKLNLETGNNKYFNVKTNGVSTIEVWKTEVYHRGDYKNVYKFVITSGSKPIYQIGSHSTFIHDQNRRYMFDGEMVDYINADNMIRLKDKYGSCHCYVYK
jgi:hypothetical protein